MDFDLRTPKTVADYLAWAATQDEVKRTELINGQVVFMAAEQVGHNRIKFAATEALERALNEAGLVGEAFISGLTVPIDLYTAYEPDALVRLGASLPRDDMTVPDPVVVVEVTSPSSAHMDTSAKLIGYFKLASVRHYLVVDPDTQTVTHHAHSDDGTESARTLSGGELRLDPPGLVIDVADLFA